MAETTSENPIRLRDWVILILVLVVMGLLITDMGRNVSDLVDRDNEATTEGSASPDTSLQP